MENIINDLLDISKIQTGKIQFNFEKVSLYKLLQESVDAVNATQHIIQLNLPVTDIQVTLDEQKISRVLINLLSNAVKYSNPSTTITISAVILGNNVQISVADEGVGIPETERKYIFDEFYRISTSTSNVTGMGLGLYIAKQIVDAHYGSIWVEGRPDKGSVFFIQLPIDQNFRA